MQHLPDLQLKAVLQLSPYDFEGSKYPFPPPYTNGKIHAYWKELLTQNGLARLEPLQEGLEYVDVAGIDDESLGVLVDLFLTDLEDARCSVSDEPEDEGGTATFTPTPWNGGVVMISQGEILMTPQCCVSLHDQREWASIEPSPEFKWIWIGHPWIYYKTEGDQVYFTRLIEKTFDQKTWHHYTTKDNTILMDNSQRIEKTEKAVDEDDLRYRVSFQLLQNAISSMQEDVAAFQHRLEQLLTQKGLADPQQIADCIVNGTNGFPSYDPDDMDN